VGYPHLREEIFEPLLPFSFRQRCLFQKGKDVLPDRQFTEYRRLLGEVPEPHPGPPVHRETGDILPVEKDRAVVRPNQPHDHIEDRGFPRAVRTQETHDLPRGNLERNTLDGLTFPISLSQVADGQ